MTNRWVWAMVAAAGLGLAACGDDDDDGAAAPGPGCQPPATATVFFHEDVHAAILTPRCGACHGTSFGSADRTTAYNAARSRVNVTTPAQSVLIQKGDAQQPVTHAGGDQLDPAHVTSITTWVRECAQNNSRTDPTGVPTTTP